MLNTLLNDLTTTEFLLLIIAMFLFFRTVLDLIKWFWPSEITLKNNNKRRR